MFAHRLIISIDDSDDRDLTKASVWSRGTQVSFGFVSHLDRMQRPKDGNAGIVSNTNMNQLPPEMLGMIFSYLKLPEIVKSVLPVCKQWYNIANGPLFWKHLKFGPNGATEDVIRVFEKSTFVKTIQINRRDDIGQIVQEVYNRCRFRYYNVEEIVLNMCCALTKCCNTPAGHQIGLVDNTSYGSHMLDLCPSLKKLSLINIQSKDLIGTNLRMLTELAIIRCHYFSPSDLQLIAENCTQLTRITILHNASHPPLARSENKPTWDEGYQDLLKKRGPFLHILRMDARFVMDSTLEDLSLLTGIHSLCLENARNLSIRGITAIRTLRYLDHLHIDKCAEIHEYSLLQLFEPGNLGFLKSLTLAKCDGMSDQCLNIISYSCPRLRKADFSDCWLVTDEGLQFLFMRCLKLRCLILFNAVSILGWSFAMIPQTIPNLKMLAVGRYCCEGKEKFLHDLAAAMPNLQIKR